MEYANGGYIEVDSDKPFFIHTCNYIASNPDLKKHFSEALEKLNEELDKGDGRGLE